MNLGQLLHERMNEILTEAEASLSRAHLTHYEKAGEEHNRQKLKALFVLTVRAISEKNLGPMLSHSEEVARERFREGFDLSEVQTAFNVLEEATWKFIMKNLPPADYGEAIGLVSTVLGAGKDMLGRTYVALASKSKATSLDLRSLFAGTY
ncbi:MAG TPA: hypothetical protein VIS48_15075 [Candidatus Kryptonia bacterium]